MDWNPSDWCKQVIGVDPGEEIQKVTQAYDAAKATVVQAYDAAKAEVSDGYQEARDWVSKKEDAVIAAAKNLGSPLKAGGSAARGSGPLGLSGSVGQGAKNNPDDVKVVQRALGLGDDGECGGTTIKAIQDFQRSLGQPRPDGRVDPCGPTAAALAGGAKAAPALHPGASTASVAAIAPAFAPTIGRAAAGVGEALITEGAIAAAATVGAVALGGAVVAAGILGVASWASSATDPGEGSLPGGVSSEEDEGEESDDAGTDGRSRGRRKKKDTRDAPAENLERDEGKVSEKPDQDGNFQRISDANKAELEESEWLTKLEPEKARRREFMEWLQENHNMGRKHGHLNPGSPEAQESYDEWLAENPKKPGTGEDPDEPVRPDEDPWE